MSKTKLYDHAGQAAKDLELAKIMLNSKAFEGIQIEWARRIIEKYRLATEGKEETR